MPYLIHRRVRTSQPQQAVGVKSDLRIAHAWALNVIGSRSIKDSAGDADGVFGVGVGGTSGNIWVIGPKGWELLFDSTGTGTYDSLILPLGNASGSAAPSGTSWTFECDFTKNINFYGVSLFGGFTGAIEVRINSDGTVELLKQAVASIGISSSALTIDVPARIAVSYDGTTAKFYINGMPAGSASSAQTFSTGQYKLGTGYNQLDKATFRQTVITDRVLPAEEILSRYQNPWQIFEDEEDYIWVPDVGGGYTATGAVPGSGSIVTGAATKTQVYSGSGAVAGTGATVTGAATRSFDSTGTVAGSGAIVTGSATNTQPSITSTGVVTGQGAIVSGAATRQFSSTGTVAGQGATVTGAATKTQVYSSTGAVVGGGAVVAGTATNTPLGISAYGDVAGQGSIVSGVATRAFSSTGAVVGAVATVAGTATRAFTATGAIAGYTAVITGAATNTPLGINGYGSVSGQGASVSGTATVTAVFTATGAVVGAGATITGYATNVRVVTSSGAISGQGATVAGAAIVSGITVWPLASDVRRGINYGPTGNDYTGTLSVGTGTGGGMNVTLSEPRLSVVSRDNSVYVIHETKRKIFS